MKPRGSGPHFGILFPPNGAKKTREPAAFEPGHTQQHPPLHQNHLKGSGISFLTRVRRGGGSAYRGGIFVAARARVRAIAGGDKMPKRGPELLIPMRGDNQRGYIRRDDPNNGSGQERHYHGKFAYAPWLSK